MEDFENLEDYEPKQYHDGPIACAMVMAVLGSCWLVYFLGCRYLIGA